MIQTPAFISRLWSLSGRNRGFTMIELLVVTTIIIVLTTIGLVSYRQAGQNARNGKRKADLETLRQALVLYRTDEGTYPTGDFNAMITEISDYLGSPAETFTDPLEDSNATYTYSYESTGSDFTLEAKLEPDGDAWQVYNP